MASLREEFARVYAQNQSWLFAFVVTLVGNVADAEEVYQEVCVALWSEFDTFDLATDFRRWAAVVARNRVLQFRTKQARNAKRLSDVAVELVAVEMVEQANLFEERRTALYQCLEKLPAADRSLVQLCYEDQTRSFRGVAETLGRSVHTLYKQLQRVRKVLRECVNRRVQATS